MSEISSPDKQYFRNINDTVYVEVDNSLGFKFIDRLVERVLSRVDPKNKKNDVKSLVCDILTGINMINDRDEEDVNMREWDFRSFDCVEVPSCLSSLIIPNRVMFDTSCPTLRHNLRRRIHFDTGKDKVSYDEYLQAISRFGILVKNFNLSTNKLSSLNDTKEVSSIYKRAVVADRIIASAMSDGCSSSLEFPIWIDDIFGAAVSKDQERMLPVGMFVAEWIRKFDISANVKKCNHEEN